MPNSKQKEKDKISTRIVRILSALLNGESIDVAGLSQEFNVSKRTIERDMQVISFFPLVKDGGRVRLAPYALNFSYFYDKNSPQSSANPSLNSSQNSAFAGGGHLDDIKRFAIKSGLARLYPRLDADLIVDILNPSTAKAYKITSAFEDSSKFAQIFEDLSVAILKHHQISCIYKEKSRSLKPYKLANIKGIWYLIADESNTLKTFTLSKLENIDIRTSTFRPKPHFITQIDSQDEWFSENKTEVVLEISNAAKEYFTRKAQIPYEIIAQNFTHFTIKTRVGFDDEALNLVKSYIPHIKIIAPCELAEKLQKQLENYLRGMENEI